MQADFLYLSINHTSHWSFLVYPSIDLAELYVHYLLVPSLPPLRRRHGRTNACRVGVEVSLEVMAGILIKHTHTTRKRHFILRVSYAVRVYKE